MVVGNGGEDGELWSGDNVGGVEEAAEAGFEDDVITFFFFEIEKGEGGEKFEFGGEEGGGDDLGRKASERG